MATTKNTPVARARFSFFVHTDEDVTVEQFDTKITEQLDIVMEELIKDTRIQDPFVSAELASAAVFIEFDVPWDDDLDQANDVANNAARCAIHAAGGGTPNWKDRDRIDTGAQHYELRSAAVEVAA